ncbi:hypothetical protein ACKWRH_23660 [Bradyrhizobium sp. Pa8]|uniref:hypothetical protein n=1 Tax=Bradyrhizobium sp. Pa8 TaxID=3386552 RepID=UPI00403F833D
MAPFKRTHELVRVGPGRPSEYRPEYCQLVIEAMGTGISVGAFAGVVGVAVDTVYEWMKRHPEFSEAVSRARGKQLLAWEQKLIRSKKGAETMASIFALKNIAPATWRDVRNVQHDHNVKVEQLTDAQLYAIAAQKAGGDGQTIDVEAVRVAETDSG